MCKKENMRPLLDKNLIRESITTRIDEYKKDKERYDKNGNLVFSFEGKIMALESLLSSLDEGNFDWRGDK